jgi:hypothetical protein
MIKIQVCRWIGDGEGCRQPSMRGLAYCEQHHDRMYDTYLLEMADYVLAKELNAITHLNDRE